MLRLRTRALLTLAVSACCVALAWAADDDGFTSLFNGKDLSGWEGDPSLWSVQDGAITGTTTAAAPLRQNQFLIWRGGTLKNFELRAKVRLIGNNNSGIQYRSRELKEIGPFVVGGYQADIHPTPENNAMLYDERGRGILAQNGQKVVIDTKGDRYVVGSTGPVQAVKLDDWNEYTVIARGNHLIHQLNGRTTVDVYDHQASERELEGILALQVHQGPPMKVQFKEIRLKTLPEGGLVGPDETPIPAGAPKVAPKKAARKKAEAKKRSDQAKAEVEAPKGGMVSTPADRLKVLKGFKADLIYSVPKEEQGSWVSMAVDPKGRLIVSDQYGKLYRVTLPPIEGPPIAPKVEPIPVAIGEAQGLLWAFDSLYVVVNTGGKFASGLYRVRDTNGDDQLDQVELLRKLNGAGEHGPHAVLLNPDGRSLTVVCGNATKLTEIDGSRVPRIWGEDHLLPRMPDGNGFMRGVLAPGGCIYRVDPDGKSWELISMGYRNEYDAAFNRDGELFTYDADMEWDMNTPWYRPTRVCHVVSGSEYGWRNGAGKWPPYYPDNLPAVVNIGPGSPTGVTFGYGAKFPAKYQEALFICDWSYGKLYAVHLKPEGASYSGDLEEFISGTPLPLTDIVINPADGAMYFAVGGRRTQSGLYRVTYIGDEPTSLAQPVANAGAEARAIRHRLEAFHGHQDPQAVATAWPYLGHPDRFLRWAARVAIEFQDPSSWRERALTETDPQAALTALLALVRVSAPDPFHRKEGDPPPDPALRARILEALDRLKWEDLSHSQKLDLLRVYEVLLNRLGRPDEETISRLIARFDPLYPAPSRELNAELCQLLVYLQAPSAAAKTLDLMAKAPTQEEQIDYARALRVLQAGWTPELRRAYFSWFLKAASFKGGNSFTGFMRIIKNDALATLTETEKAELKPILEAQQPSTATAAAVAPPRPFVKSWTVDELVPVVEKDLKGRDFDRGRSLFAAAQCFSCHRFNNEGGSAGPDLTGVSGRFSVRDLLESIILPSKTISDQYEAVTIATTDGEIITGRIVNLHNDNLSINTDMLNPNKLVNIHRKKIEAMKPSPVSMMPEGLLNTLNQDEILDLLAYLLSRGDRENAMFQPQKAQ
ncbi:MAG: DUF1080 domain-containing protein [Isosphaeraceae bacterium]|nr:DUF1080 domain-containing protein [Isosphaeraceae bacterium]